MQRRLVKALEDLCVQYDGSVRTSDKSIVQMKYGDDGLDPIMMGGGMLVVDFEHAFRNIQALNPCPGEAMLTVKELREQAAAVMESQEIIEQCSSRFLDSLGEFLEKRAVKLENFTEYASKGGVYSPQEVEMAVGMVHRVTANQLAMFFADARVRYDKAVIQPGTAVGAIAAQSIGEPGTQMTLKSFHFAGIATGVSVTQGVPRIKEIINASANIKAPVVYVPLINGHDLSAVRIVKGRIERTYLGEVADSIEQILTPRECFVCIKLDMERIRTLQLNITAPGVVRALLEHKKLKLKGGVRCKGNEIRVLPPDCSREGMLYSLQTLCALLPEVVVCGIPTVARAVISRKSKDSPYELQVEGSDIRQVMATTGVNGTNVVSNDLIAVEKTLGIEAARLTIMKEIQFTMSEHGTHLLSPPFLTILPTP
jgi:DNA-directed RNA polymerase III subunit RPC1